MRTVKGFHDANSFGECRSIQTKFGDHDDLTYCEVIEEGAGETRVTLKRIVLDDLNLNKTIRYAAQFIHLRRIIDYLAEQESYRWRVENKVLTITVD